MRVAAVQYKARKGDFDASLAELVDLAEIGAQGRELVVLPEMAATGYWFPDGPSARLVSEHPEGPTFRALADVARRRRCWIVSGFVEDAGDKLYNSAHVIDPMGDLADVYRKTVLYEADLPWATPGDSGWRTFQTHAGEFAVGICMDLNDDSFIAWITEHQPRALAFPTNWVDQDHAPWNYWAYRLLDTGTALVAANSYGADGDLTIRGESAILDGTTLLATAPKVGNTVLGAILA
jgi:predicted amidohydrolase